MRYSAIRFEMPEPIVAVDTDALCIELLFHDVRDWLAGDPGKIEAAKASVVSLRKSFNFTPFSIAKRLEAKLSVLSEILR